MTDQPAKPIQLADYLRLKDAGYSGVDLYAQADRIERPDNMGGWTREKVGAMYDQAHSDARLPWMTDQVIGLIDTAYQYQTDTGGAALPTELTSYLDSLPQFAMPEVPVVQEDPAQAYWQQNAVTQDSPYANYGLTEEQWQALGPWKQLGMRLFGSNTAAGAATGFMGGLQGGPVGAVTGVALGAGLGKLSEQYPWLGKVFDKLDIPVENLVMRPLGTLAQGVSAAKAGKFDQFLSELNEAWIAGEQVFRVNLPTTTEPGSFMSVQYTPGERPEAVTVWEGPANPLGSHVVTAGQLGTAALEEYRARLVAGESEAALNAEYEQRYGFAGQTSDLAARIFLDPLNIAGPVLAKGIGLTGRLLGAGVDFAQAFDAPTPTRGLKNFKSLAESMGAEDYAKLKPFEKWLAGSPLKDGQSKYLLDPERGVLGGLFHLTPEARALELNGIATRNLGNMADMHGMDPHVFARNYDLIAKNDPASSQLLGRQYGSSEWGAITPAMKDTSQHIHKAVDDFDNPVMVDMRAKLKSLASVVGEDPGTIIKKLTDPKNGERNATVYLKRMGEAGADMDPAALVDLGEALKGAPLDERMLTGQLMGIAQKGQIDWSINHFKITEDPVLIRLSNFTKTVQGAFLLDVSPTYYLQNGLDGTMKMFREGGLFGFVKPGSADAYLNDFYGGLTPDRLESAKQTDTGQPVLGGVAEQAIMKAKSGGGKIDKATQAVAGLRKKTGLPGMGRAIEQAQTKHMYAVALKQAWGNWKKGTYRPMSSGLEEKLGPALTKFVYGEINKHHNIERVMDGLFVKDPARVDVDAGIGDAISRLGVNDKIAKEVLDKTGIADWLRENVTADMTAEQIRGKFTEHLPEIQNQLRDWYSGVLLEEVQKAIDTGTAEGALGLYGPFDELDIVPGDQRMHDWMEWENLWAIKDDITPKAFDARMAVTYGWIADGWKRTHQQIKATYLGAVDKIGVDSSYGKALADTLMGEEAIWADFFKTVNKERREFFKKQKGQTWDAAGWAELKRKHSERYHTDNQRVTALQAERDAMLVDLLGRKYGEAVRASAQTWRDGVRKINAELFQMMEDFRTELEGVRFEDRNAAWNDFINHEYKPKLMERMTQNREGAAYVFAEADKAQRTGVKPVVEEVKAVVEPEPVKAAEPTGAKEPWQMTDTEYLASENGKQRYEQEREILITELERRLQVESKSRSSIDRAKAPWTKKELDSVRSGKEEGLTARTLILRSMDLGKPTGRRAIIEQAVTEGKPVPAEVLQDYPDLAAKYGKQATTEATLSAWAKDVGAKDYQSGKAYTAEFKKWFGDSKVVDDKGAPLKVYHGTTKEFTEFLPGKGKRNMQLGFGIHFAEDPQFVGNFYATGSGGNVRGAYLRIQKILKADEVYPPGTPEYELGARLYKSTKFGINPDGVYLQNAIDATSPARAEKMIREAGYDGVRYEANVIGGGHQLGTLSPSAGKSISYLVFDADQIKPAYEGFATPRPDPDPVGIAPPGTIEGLKPTPPAYKMLSEGMNETMPLLHQIEQMLVEQSGRDPIGVKTANLDPATIAELKAYIQGSVMDDMSSAKLAASKYAEMATDSALLNYGRRLGIDNYLNMLFPYQFWYTRSAANWMLTAVDRPAWFAHWYRMREAQEKMSRPLPGFPTRLSGKMQIAAPWLPDGWGDTIYFDPLHQAFGFEAMASQITRPLQRDFSNTMSRAQYLLWQMSDSGEISLKDAQNAWTMQTGALWDKAYAQAQAEIDADIESPMDLVSAMMGFSLPIQWALSRKEVKNALQGAGLGWMGLSERASGMGTYPSFATIQSLSSFVKPGGVNLPEFVKKALGATETNDRGFLWDYYVSRELSNMAAQGADVEAVKLAMVQKSGDLYQKAVDTVGKQGGIKQFASVFWSDFFPEGEQQQRVLKMEFQKAADAGKMTEFFAAHPEYEARLQQNNWDDPEGMLRGFVKSALWDSYYKLEPLEQKTWTKEAGRLWKDAFLNKETRSYDAIDTETMIQWLRQLKGTVPENAPAVPQGEPVQMPEASTTQSYNGYLAWREAQPGYALSNVYNGLPRAMQGQFELAHPEVVAYQDARNIFISQHPELIPYLISEDNKLKGAAPEIQMEVYDYRAEKAMLFPMIDLASNLYHSLESKAEQKAFLKQHPELGDYWDWLDEKQGELSAGAFYYVKGESGIDKLRGKEAAYYVDYDKFSPDLSMLILHSTLTGKSLNTGTRAALRSLWKQEGEPMSSFEAWLSRVLEGFQL